MIWNKDIKSIKVWETTYDVDIEKLYKIESGKTKFRYTRRPIDHLQVLINAYYNDINYSIPAKLELLRAMVMYYSRGTDKQKSDVHSMIEAEFDLLDRQIYPHFLRGEYHYTLAEIKLDILLKDENYELAYPTYIEAMRYLITKQFSEDYTHYIHQLIFHQRLAAEKCDLSKIENAKNLLVNHLFNIFYNFYIAFQESDELYSKYVDAMKNESETDSWPYDNKLIKNAFKLLFPNLDIEKFSNEFKADLFNNYLKRLRSEPVSGRLAWENAHDYAEIHLTVLELRHNYPI